MLQRKLNDKIAPLIKCSPTVYTLSAALFSTTTPVIVILILHTPVWLFKAALVYSTFSLFFSILQWTKLIINKR